MLGSILHGLLLIEHELLLFAAFWFVISLIDEVAVDLYWLWLKLNGQAKTQAVPVGLTEAPLLGPAAIIVAAWQEHAVIGSMISHTLKSWCQVVSQFEISSPRFL